MLNRSCAHLTCILKYSNDGGFINLSNLLRSAVSAHCVRSRGGKKVRYFYSEVKLFNVLRLVQNRFLFKYDWMPKVYNFAVALSLFQHCASYTSARKSQF